MAGPSHATTPITAGEMAAFQLALRLSFISYTISALSYGLYLVFSLMGIELLLKRKSKRALFVSLAYSSIMLCITTTWFITVALTNEEILVEPRHTIVSPFSRDYCLSTSMAAVVLISLQIIGSDALLMYRTYVICERRKPIIILPLLAWIAFIVLVVVSDVLCIPLTENVRNRNIVILAYMGLTVGCNVYCTLAICSTLVRHQHMLRQHNISSGMNYRLLTSLIAESGLLYTIAGLIDLVFTIRQSPYSIITNAIWAALVYLTPAQIILRVALGIEYRTSRGDSSHDFKYSLPPVFVNSSGTRQADHAASI